MKCRKHGEPQHQRVSCMVGGELKSIEFHCPGFEQMKPETQDAVRELVAAAAEQYGDGSLIQAGEIEPIETEAEERNRREIEELVRGLR